MCKRIVASNIEELKVKSSEKLQIPKDINFKMKDETDLEDKDVFNLLDNGSTIFALEKGQQVQAFLFWIIVIYELSPLKYQLGDHRMYNYSMCL